VAKGSDPAASKSGSNPSSPDIPLWATADVYPGSHSRANARQGKERLADGHSSHLEPLLTVKETAEILKVSPRTVRRLIASKAIRAVSIRRSMRVRPRDIRRLIATGGVGND
jgi:excisionase family DNA binding protein